MLIIVVGWLGLDALCVWFVRRSVRVWHYSASLPSSSLVYTVFSDTKTVEDCCLYYNNNNNKQICIVP